MGFDCKYCGEKELNVFESDIVEFMCWDCHRSAGYPENVTMKRHREANECVTTENAKANIVANK